MRIYLVAKKGEQTAFKITTAHVLTDLDSILNEFLEQSSERTWRYDVDVVEQMILTQPNYNIYYAELDDMNNTAKKLTGELWKRAINSYASRFKHKIIDANNKRNKLIKEKKERDKMRIKTAAQIEVEFESALSEDNLNIGLLKRPNKDNEFDNEKYIKKIEQNSDHIFDLLEASI